MTLENFVPNNADPDRPSGPCSIGDLHAHLFLDLTPDPGWLTVRSSMKQGAELHPDLKACTSLGFHPDTIPVCRVVLQCGAEALQGRVSAEIAQRIVGGGGGAEPQKPEDMPLPPPAEAPPADDKPLPEPAAAEAPRAEEAPPSPQGGAGRRTGIAQAARALAEKREQLQKSRMELGNAQLRVVKLQQDAEIAQAEVERVRGRLAEAEQLAESLPETLETRQMAFDIAERELKLALGV